MGRIAPIPVDPEKPGRRTDLLFASLAKIAFAAASPWVDDIGFRHIDRTGIWARGHDLARDLVTGDHWQFDTTFGIVQPPTMAQIEAALSKMQVCMAHPCGGHTHDHFTAFGHHIRAFFPLQRLTE